jgi:hypothetical protein
MEELNLLVLALSLAASMFEVNGSDTDILADTDTELYILGIKYKTPNGKSFKYEAFFYFLLIKIDSDAILHDVVSRFWFTYRSGFAPIGS